MARPSRGGAAVDSAPPVSYALRSKTGAPFRRGGVTFAPDRWEILTDPTDEQLAEPMLQVVEITEANADELALFPATEGQLLTWPISELPAGELISAALPDEV